jgi:coenzyme F420-reducing hydrogenase delta subunit
LSVLTETKIVQAVNRLESARQLLEEIGKQDNRFNNSFAKIIAELGKFEEELRQISKTLNVENLGKRSNGR